MRYVWLEVFDKTLEYCNKNDLDFTKVLFQLNVKKHKSFNLSNTQYPVVSLVPLFVGDSNNIKLLIPLTNHILRGIIDGDGYIRKGKGHIEIATQSDNLRLQIIEYLTSNDIHCTSHSSTSVFIVGIYRKDSIKKLYNLLYNNASVFLERKKDRITATLI